MDSGADLLITNQPVGSVPSSAYTPVFMTSWRNWSGWGGFVAMTLERLSGLDSKFGEFTTSLMPCRPPPQLCTLDPSHRLTGTEHTMARVRLDTLTCALLALLLAACAGVPDGDKQESTTSVSDTAEPVDVTAVDSTTVADAVVLGDTAGPEDTGPSTACPGGVGCPCKENSECDTVLWRIGVIGPHLLLARVDNHHLSDKIAAWIIRLALQRGQPSPPESAGPVDIAGNLCVGAQFAVSASRGGRMAAPPVVTAPQVLRL